MVCIPKQHRLLLICKDKMVFLELSIIDIQNCHKLSLLYDLWFLYIFVASIAQRIYVKEKNLLPKTWEKWKYSSVFCDFVCVYRKKEVPSNICLCFISKQYPPIHKANSLVATFARCSPYSCTLALFWKIRLRLMNMPITLHSHKQTSVMNVNGIFNR